MKYFSYLFCLVGLVGEALFIQNNADILSISKIMEGKGIPGISYAWLEEGKLRESFAFGKANNENHPVDQETVFSAASLSKPIFAYLVMQLLAEEMLDLDTPLYTYFDYWGISEDPRHKLVTAKMVLSHTSGLPKSKCYGILSPFLGRAGVGLWLKPEKLLFPNRPQAKAGRNPDL